MKLISKNIATTGIMLLMIPGFVQLSRAQIPWNAKVMLHSLNGYVDTLWIGALRNFQSG